MNDDNCPGCKRKDFNLDADAVNALVDEIPLSAENRADEAIISKRLALCLDCDAAREDVLCAYCGCFIRFRIRSKKAYCPHPAGSKWQSTENAK